MSAALHAFDSQIAGIVKRRVVLCLYKGQLVEHGIAIARSIHQQLCARVEANQKIFVAIEVKVAVREDVEPSAPLITYHDRQRVLKLLAKADIEHAGVERAAPHAHVEPAWSRKRTRNSA